MAAARQRLVDMAGSRQLGPQIMRMESLFEEKRQVEAEIERILMSSGLDKECRVLPYDQVGPLMRQTRKLDEEIATRRTMLSRLLKEMLSELESLISGAHAAAASELVRPANLLAGMVYEERTFKWQEIAEGLATYQQNRSRNPGGSDFLAEFSRIVS
jgi:hypothetical protein